MVTERKSRFAVNSSRALIMAVFGLQLWLTPFYLWESGLPQLTHLAGGAVVLLLLLLRRRFVWQSGVMAPAALFAVYALVVNLIVYLFYEEWHTLISSFYYLYNVTLFWAVLQIFYFEPSRAMKLTRFPFLTLIGLQAVAFALGKGRFFGDSRFMGTFNDPNQLAHWVLWAVIIVLVADYSLRFRLTWWSWLALTLGSVVLLASASRSGLLGFSVIVLGVGTYYVFHRIRLRRKVVQKLLVSLSIFVFIVAFGLSITVLGASDERVFDLQKKLGQQVQFYVARVHEGIFKGGQNLEERGYDRLWKFPDYLFLGAGEGANERWAEKSTFLGEIHSTLAGVAFYYGIPGTVLILFLIGRVWVSLPRVWLRILLLAPLLYSLGTYNLRNSMFWLGLAVLWAAGRALRQSTENGLEGAGVRAQARS